MPTGQPARPLRNRILGSLSATDYRRLESVSEFVELKIRDVVWDAGQRIPFVYFPENSLISVVSTMEDGASVEVGVIGRQGMAGLPILFGTESSPHEGFVQVAGDATRIPSDAFERRAVAGTTLHRLLMRYTHSFLQQTSQGAACNRLHSLKQRCARWLLMTRDQLGESEFLLTQEFLSQMLGVRRPGVTNAASELHDAGLIAYRRGKVRILDAEGLKAAACECYTIISAEAERVFRLASGNGHRRK